MKIQGIDEFHVCTRRYWMESDTVYPLDVDLDWLIGFGLISLISGEDAWLVYRTSWAQEQFSRCTV